MHREMVPRQRQSRGGGRRQEAGGRRQEAGGMYVIIDYVCNYVID